MKRTRACRTWLGAAAAAALLLGQSLASADAGLSPAEARGQQIYREGTSASGRDVMASVGAEAVVLPASAVPCASCHGRDGLGRPEGGVIPPDIRWSQLTKVYGHVHDDGRKHPAFDEASFSVLLRTGVDPAGNRIDQAMPLYALGDEDMADLVAYMKRLESDLDPGVSAERVQVATLLPLGGPQGAVGQAMAQVMHAYFQELNERGGVFQRQVDLLIVPYGNSAEETLSTLHQAMEREGVFALVGPYSVGLDHVLLDMLRGDGVPLIAPFTLDPGDEILNTNAFYLYPGLPEQARVLAEKALAETTDAPLLLVGPAGAQTDRLAAAVQEQVRGRVAEAPLVLHYTAGKLDPGALAGQVGESAPAALFFFGPQSDLTALLPALAERELTPRVYLLGVLMPHSLFDAPAAFDQRLFLAQPTLPSDISPAGRDEYQRLAQRYALPPDHLQGQVAALAAAKLLTEGMKRVGRDLSRQALEEGIEALYQYRTEVTPPLTYGPTRRIGARGAHVVVVDLEAKQQRPVGPWVELP